MKTKALLSKKRVSVTFQCFANGAITNGGELIKPHKRIWGIHKVVLFTYDRAASYKFKQMFTQFS